jgi:ribonuclease VapC
MIVLDSSALIALLLGEPLAGVLAARLAADVERVISVASYLEAGTVLAGRQRLDCLRAIEFLDIYLAEAGIELRPVDETQIRIALDARIRYGRGMGHGGVLNFGDAFSYALAKSLDAPLLFIGGDFTTTDIKSALD